MIATDIDAPVVAAASRRSVRQATRWAVADARALPFVAGSIDLVFAYYVVHHLTGVDGALAEIGRVLRPGGRLLVVDVVRPGWITPRGDGAARAASDPRPRLRSRAEIERALAGADFRIVRARSIPGALVSLQAST